MANFWDEFDDELLDDDEDEFDNDEDEDEDCIMDEDDAMIANCWAKVAQQALSRCDGCGGEDCACCEVFAERQSYLAHEMTYENGWY